MSLVLSCCHVGRGGWEECIEEVGACGEEGGPDFGGGWPFRRLGAGRAR